MEKNKVFEKQFKKRYGKTVTVLSEVVKNKEGEVVKAIAEIGSDKGKKYTLIDIMKNGATVNVILEKDDKKYVYDNYLEAEVNVADAISEEV